MTFKITGHSGCLIELRETEGKAFVRKQTQKLDYVDRLAAQAQKQAGFLRLKLPQGFDVPVIYQVRRSESLAFFDMAYVNAFDFISFFTNADIHTVDSFCDTLQSWLEQCVREAVLEPFPKEAFLLKYQQTKEALYKNPLIDALVMNALLEDFEKQLAAFAPSALLPRGICHGDMTFSNMLIHNPQQITLIDMLDNFIETPLQDMVKLRQDTCFFWSLPFYKGDFNRLHIKAIMRRIDKTIDTHCKQYPFYREYYTLFQILNHLRILPYAKDKNVVLHSCHVLKKLLMSSVCI